MKMWHDNNHLHHAYVKLLTYCHMTFSLQWRQNGRHGVSNHQPHHYLLSRLFRRRSKKTSKLRVTGLFLRNSPFTGDFPAEIASNAENVSIWWYHHVSIAITTNFQRKAVYHQWSWNYISFISTFYRFNYLSVWIRTGYQRTFIDSIILFNHRFY